MGCGSRSKGEVQLESPMGNEIIGFLNKDHVRPAFGAAVMLCFLHLSLEIRGTNGPGWPHIYPHQVMYIRSTRYALYRR